jgi:hypothetical protein
MAVLLLFVAVSLPQPDFFKNQLIKLKDDLLADPIKTKQQLLSIKGIKQVAISLDEGVAYLKVDKNQLDQPQLDTFSLLK